MEFRLLKQRVPDFAMAITDQVSAVSHFAGRRRERNATDSSKTVGHRRGQRYYSNRLITVSAFLVSVFRIQIPRKNRPSLRCASPDE